LPHKAPSGGTRRIDDTNRKSIYFKENAPMPRILSCLTAAVLVAALNSSTIAQTPAPADKPGADTPTTAEQVEAWSRKQWQAARKEWAKDKAKWADCRKQSRDQNLRGRKSWSFLYTCMKTPA
jgi:hypothetical protein